VKIRSAIALGAVFVSVGGCATKSDMADLQATLVGEFESERSQREALIAEIQVLRAVLLDSLSVQQRRDITGRVDLQRQIQELNLNLAQLIELTGQTQRDLALMSVVPADSSLPGERTDGQPGPVTDEPEPGAASGNPQELYEAALRQFRRGSYGTARTALDEFLSRYPNDELAPDAQYFRAETFAEEGDAATALDEYARVLELYPNSRRAPTALYKSGLLELRRGNADDARTFFNRVVQGYPDSDEFELAQRELDRLSS
jgi:tol-pal system protein YbgF